MAVLPTELGPVRLPTATARLRIRRIATDALRVAVPRPRETPFTFWYLALLGASTTLLNLLDPNSKLLVLRRSSTDVMHLATRPLFVLVTSAWWIDGILNFAAVVVVLGTVGSLLERRLGTRSALAIFVAGHVGATLITEGAIAIGVHAALLPSTSLSRLDVGVSYGLAATLGAAARLLPKKVRLLGVFAAWLYLGAPLLTDLDMTSWGHAIAVAIGMAWWPAISQLTHVNRFAHHAARGRRPTVKGPVRRRRPGRRWDKEHGGRRGRGPR